MRQEMLSSISQQEPDASEEDDDDEADAEPSDEDGGAGTGAFARRVYQKITIAYRWSKERVGEDLRWTCETIKDAEDVAKILYLPEYYNKNKRYYESATPCTERIVIPRPPVAMFPTDDYVPLEAGAGDAAPVLPPISMPAASQADPILLGDDETDRLPGAVLTGYERIQRTLRTQRRRALGNAFVGGDEERSEDEEPTPTDDEFLDDEEEGEEA